MNTESTTIVHFQSHQSDPPNKGLDAYPNIERLIKAQKPLVDPSTLLANVRKICSKSISLLADTECVRTDLNPLTIIKRAEDGRDGFPFGVPDRAQLSAWPQIKLRTESNH